MDPLTALAVFVAYLLVDALYALYTLAVARLQPALAATVGAGMHFLLAAGVLAYTENIVYLIPIAAGSWLGTYLLVRWQLGKQAQDA